MLLIYALLAAALLGFLLLERSRLGVIFRMIGAGRNARRLAGRLRLPAKGARGRYCRRARRHRRRALCASDDLCRAAHFRRDARGPQPRLWPDRRARHRVRPLLGVLIDIGLLESIRALAGYRMIIFGGLVALLLIVRPRGLLDENVVHRIGRGWRRMFPWARRPSLKQAETAPDTIGGRE